MSTPTRLDLPLFVSCPRGLEPLLVDEMTSLGATRAQPRNGGVEATGELSLVYRACLESRLASRVLLPLRQFPLEDPDALYAGARELDWPSLFPVDACFAVEVAGRSPVVRHTHFAGLRIKDAIADQFRERCGQRPDVDARQPDISVHLHLSRQSATLSLDLSGDSLHRRGYRVGTGEAPLKENLASALLLRAGWPAIAQAGAPLIDPMCGSGTLLIEGAWMAAGIAPGLRRQRFGFQAWRGHDSALWGRILEQARRRGEAGIAALPPILGFDEDPKVLGLARRNVERAGLAGHIELATGDATRIHAPAGTPGLWLSNPPYGERLGGEAEVVKLLSLLGHRLRHGFPGWRAALFTARPDLAPRLGLRAQSIHAFYNGDLECKLLSFDVPADPPANSDGAFANRLAKNLRHLSKWSKRQDVDCYRIYDADLPEYAVAVDLYRSAAQETRLHVQEYAAPAGIDPVKAEKRLRESLVALQDQFDLPARAIHLKQRRVQKGKHQYQRQSEQGEFLEIIEHGCRLWVNLDEYLDTGLFLDHRPMRRRLQAESAGKRVLNLFCYTGAATVHAARGGARSTLSIDLSNTYLQWAQRNLALNGIQARFERREARTPERGVAPPHRLLRADCMSWLANPPSDGTGPFDLIFCDPPTFSNSKKLEGVFDVDRDHVTLIRGCMQRLAPGGTLYFSTNRRRFKLDTAALPGLQARDITPATLDEDFRRGTAAHRCWSITAA